MEEFKAIMKESYNIDVLENKKGELRYVPSIFKKNNSDCIKPCHERRLGGSYGKKLSKNHSNEKKNPTTMNERGRKDWKDNLPQEMLDFFEGKNNWKLNEEEEKSGGT